MRVLPKPRGLGPGELAMGEGQLRITPAILGAAGVRDWKPVGVPAGRGQLRPSPGVGGALPWDVTARLSPCHQAHEATGPPATPAVRFPCLDSECPHVCFLAFSFFSTPQPRGRPPAHCSPLEAVPGQSERSRRRTAGWLPSAQVSILTAGRRAGVNPAQD